MMRSRLSTIALLSLACGAPTLYASDLSTYRGMHFGMNVATAAKQAGTPITDVRTTHQSPAVIQELDWQIRPSLAADPNKPDPVKDGVLSFSNGQLFRMVITYDRYKVAGMTADDMIEGISTAYGAATRPAAEIAFHSIYGEVTPVLGRWEDSQYSYNLIRTGDRSTFALVLFSKALDPQAQTAITEAMRLEAQQAPEREIARQQKRDQEERLVLEKARLVNKPNFRP